MLGKKKVAIVCPVANEAETIHEFCYELRKAIQDLNIQATVFFVIDNVSKDNTLRILKKISQKYPEIQVIFEPKNRHVVDAYIRGYQEALRKKCDYIIEMDGGFSHLPSELFKFIQGFTEGYDCVFGIRPLWSPAYNVPLKRRIYSLGGTILSNLLLGTTCKDMTSGYEGFTKKALREILKKPLLSQGHFFQTEIRYRAKGMKFKEVYISYQFPSKNVNQKSLQNSFEVLFTITKERLFHHFQSQK